MKEIIRKKIQFDDTSVSGYDAYKNAGYIINDSSYFLAIHLNNNIEYFQGKITDRSDLTLNIIKDYSIKESFLITAIKNLLKQKRYLNLMYEFSHELIDSEEFNKELEVNESKYLINADFKIKDLEHLSALLKIIDEIDEEFNEEDLTEIFSIENSFVIKNFGNSKHTTCIEGSAKRIEK
ncbi:hypothetical protein GCM10022216_14490 [Sphingobacterium kyonggiense]|uniref:Uncharacterized protein n=1 Tax=Sphingobacterium kyonggiense TaxID=714075 RepID=A0ABP7YLE1_9SPHI